MFKHIWLVYALLSAVFAAGVAILGKIGMRDVDANLATAVRSIVMTIFLVAVCGAMGLWTKVQTLGGRPILMIVLSGLAGALSWLFYFKAIQMGTVSQVSPIDKLSVPLAVLLAVAFLGERPTSWNWIGIVMIVAGAILVARPGHA